jgi:molybdate transport system permease protein
MEYAQAHGLAAGMVLLSFAVLLWLLLMKRRLGRVMP